MIALLGLFPTLFAPFIGSLLSIASSAASILAGALSALWPVLVGITSFAVWFIKSFFTGLGVIIQNLSVLSVIIVCVLVTFIYIHTIDTRNLVAQVKQQKAYDASHQVPHSIKPLHRKPVAKKTDTTWDFNPLGL